jgi:hypothetical protein
MLDLSCSRGYVNGGDVVCLTGVVTGCPVAPDDPRPQGVNIVNYYGFKSPPNGTK